MQNVNSLKAPSPAFLISPAIGPLTRCQVDKSTVEAGTPFISIGIPDADSLIELSISSTSSMNSRGTCGPCTEVSEAASIMISLPLP